MGVITESKSTSPDSYWALPYVIPSAIMNVLCVVLLIYLVATLKGKSNFYKLVVAILLVSGLAAEIYMTTLLDMTNTAQEVGTWIVIVLNWLFRAFYVLEFVQEEWTPLFPAAKDVAKAASSSSSSSSGVTDVKKELRKRFDDYKKALKDRLKASTPAGGKVPRYTDDSSNAASKFISDLADPKLSDLDGAKKLLKLDDGRSATSVLAGGRR